MKNTIKMCKIGEINKDNSLQFSLNYMHIVGYKGF